MRPIISEKSLQLANEENVFTFAVGDKANKISIKNEVSKKYGVEVVSVRTLNVLGKYKTFGKKRSTGKRKDVKKALVKLNEGDTISDFNIN